VRTLPVLRVWVTNGQRGIEEGTPIAVTTGKTQFTLNPASYTTLLREP